MVLMAIVFIIGPNSFDPKSAEHNAFAEQLWNIGKNSAFALIPPMNPESPEMANIPPTKPAANPGLSAILRAMKPAKSAEHNAFAEQLWNIGKNSAFALIIPVLAGFIARSPQMHCVQHS
jgi:fructose-specific phosphotransferase system IIC component